MRSKAPLILMEQMIMLLVFALAAALCLQAFVKSDESSRRMEDRDHAVILAQSAAETVRSVKGDLEQAAGLLGLDQYDQDSLMIDYDEDWTRAEDHMRYTLGVCRVDPDVPGLGKADVWVRDEAAEEELFRVEVAWQGEVDGDAE